MAQFFEIQQQQFVAVLLNKHGIEGVEYFPPGVFFQVLVSALHCADETQMDSPGGRDCPDTRRPANSRKPEVSLLGRRPGSITIERCRNGEFDGNTHHL